MKKNNTKNKTSIDDINSMIIRDYKNRVSKKQLQDMLVVCDMLIDEELKDEDKEHYLGLFEFKTDHTIKTKLNTKEYEDFLLGQNNFDFINLEMNRDDNKKIGRVYTYIYNQKKHNYEIILWVDYVKNNWFNTKFRKQPFKNIDVKIFYKGEIDETVKNLVG